MPVVEGFKAAGLFAKVAFILMTVASMFTWISFTCTGWGESKAGRHYGLWRICTDDKYDPNCESVDGWALDWWAATQAFVIFGFVGVNVAFLLVVLYIFVGVCSKNQEVAMASAGVGIATALLYFIGAIVFVAKFKEVYIDPRDSNPFWPKHKIGYCFALSIVAIVLEIVAGILMILDAKKIDTPTSIARPSTAVQY